MNPWRLQVLIIAVLQNTKNVLSDIKVGKDILMFGAIEIEKTIFYRNKTPNF